MSSYPPHVIVLIGPTASGKTELAIETADYFKTRIHNIDSRQIYNLWILAQPNHLRNNNKKLNIF